MSRVGLYTWPDGTRYEGEWREHTRDGFGVHTYADGTRYEVRSAGTGFCGKILSIACALLARASFRRD